MRKLLASIAALMMVLTLWSGFQSSVAYAAEIGGCAAALEGTPPGHTTGDADEVSSDGDKATPHHHNMGHSHEIGVPARDWAATPVRAIAAPQAIAAVAPPRPVAPHTDLRPPIA
jgi:hypothetical protein